MDEERRRPLGSTYRIQLNGFGFRAAADLVGYLDDLGVETIYLSPVARATSGSSHGYDVVDPTTLDPQLGTAGDFELLLREAASHRMRLLLDIVPNHMSTSRENDWWTDVLRHGEKSEFAGFFDIDWSAGGGRVVLPVLERPLSEVLAAGELNVRAAPSGELMLWHGESRFPLAPRGAGAHAAEDLERPVHMRELLEAQHYRLAYWKVAPYELNYRRFFDINDLVGVRVENPEVYRRTHALTFSLASDPRVAGVRVDHVDGLADPEEYLRRLNHDLATASGTHPVILVEKILARDETVPESWPVDGTTGYEFADLAMAVLTDRTGARILSGDTYEFRGQGVAARREAMEQLFPGQLDRLVGEIKEFVDARTPGHDIPLAALRSAIVGLTECLSVYRIYATPESRSSADAAWLESAFTDARTSLEGDLAIRALSVLRSLLSGAPFGETPDQTSHRAIEEICVRWQQLSSAVAAKGIEDTALYRFGGLGSAADVGSDPGAPAISVATFHEAMRRRARSGTSGLNTTSTHDSKRSEDSRCRIAALSEMPDRWTALIDRLDQSASDHIPAEVRSSVYQAIVAIWPLAGEWDDRLTDRVVSFAVKATRESKQYTSWAHPDDAFERDLTEFIRDTFVSEQSRLALGKFCEGIDLAGVVNSLALVVLKTSAPGVPDTYQGTETWRALLVDPDNRLPVDFPRMRKALADLPEPGDVSGLGRLVMQPRDGALKTFVLRNALRTRRAFPSLFSSADYVPVEAHGRHRDRIVAFQRKSTEGTAIAVVPRLTVPICEGRLPVGGVWGDTELVLPRGSDASFRNVFTGDLVKGRSVLEVADLLATLPVALLIRS